MKKAALVFLLLFALCLCLIAPTRAGGVNWLYSIKEGQAQAQKMKKPIMINFYADNNPWCKKLDKETFKNSKVIKLLAEFVCVKINGGKNKNLTYNYGINTYPTIKFLNPNGTSVGTIPGYLPPESFINLLKDALKRFKKS